MNVEATSSRNRIVLNISGEIFETWEETLDKYPETLLGNSRRRSDFFCFESNQFFFNRNRAAFESILYYYQSNGKLVRPSNVRIEAFETECIYFELPPSAITDMKSKEGMFISTEKLDTDQNYLMKILWDLVERPESSISAKCFALFSLSMILLAVILACLESIPEVQSWINEYKKKDSRHFIEYGLNGWFLLELLLRLLASPNKWQFLTAPINIIDTVAVVPYFIIISINGNWQYHRTLRIIRFVRIIRLFHLGKQSKRMKLIGKILMSTIDDFKELFLCLVVVIIFGGSIVYYTEMDNERSSFTSIPQALWWAVQTVVVLGYGDIVPITYFGKLFASFFMVFGALTIALPVLSVVTKLSAIYATNINAHEH